MRRPRKQINQINVVPYIDVMLVLLIIFMVTAPMMSPTQIDLPSIGQDAAPPPAAPLEVSIKLDKSVWLRDLAGGGEAKKLSRDKLVAEIKAKQSNGKNQAVVIAADKAVRYEEVIAVLDLLQQNDIKKVGLLAKPQQ